MRPWNKGTHVNKHVCYACGSTNTYRNKSGAFMWNLNRDENGNVLHALCEWCDAKHVSRAWYKGTFHTLAFPGRRIRLKFNPRKGRCVCCGREGRTDLHHTIYDESNPLANTVELCDSCHMKQSWKDGGLAKYRRRDKQMPRYTIT